MGGFKSGAADDDWGETSSAGDESGTESDPTAEGGDADSEVDISDNAIRSSGDENSTAEGSDRPHRDLPWILTRNSITDGRDQTVQLHLQQSTIDAQREATRALEASLGETVRKADLREAALLVGLEHTDEVAATLREWGYDLG